MAIRIGNAPCSWGALEFEGLGESAGYKRVLDEMAETGYAGTELGDWGFMPTDPDLLWKELQARKLIMLGAFVPVNLKADNNADVAVKTAKLLADVGTTGSEPFIVLADDNGKDPVRTANAGRITDDMGLGEAAWKTFARNAEHVARTVTERTGLRTVFHHHCAGYVETPDEIAHLMKFTDASALGLVFDTGHYAYGAGGGESVVEALDRFGDRIHHMHFKDCDPDIARQARLNGWDYFEAVRRGVFCELGKGCVDFPAVLDWLRKHKYSGWIVVEQDVLPGMGTPKESARRNREYLKSIGI
jgi:inosose dehydratase